MASSSIMSKTPNMFKEIELEIEKNNLADTFSVEELLKDCIEIKGLGDGFKLEVSHFKGIEHLLVWYYESNGWDAYRVSKSTTGDQLPKDLVNVLERNLSKEKNISDIFTAGVPDILVFKPSKLDYKFIEVKSSSDSIRISQLKWMFLRFPNLKSSIVFESE